MLISFVKHFCRTGSRRYIPVDSVRATIDDVFTGVPNQLFQTHRRPDGKEYSFHEVAAKLDGQLSPGYLAKLRNGTSGNPSRQSLLLLCQFFKVPASYFFPELDDLAEEEPSEDEKIAIALRSSSLSEDVQNLIQGMIRVARNRGD